MDSIGIEEIGLLSDGTQVVAFPADLFSGNRTQFFLTQDSSNVAPAEGLTLEDMGMQYLIPVQIVQDVNQPAGSNDAFLIDSTQLAYFTGGQMMIEANTGGVPASTCDLLAATAEGVKSTDLVATIPASMASTECTLSLTGVNNCDLLIESADVSSADVDDPGVPECLLEHQQSRQQQQCRKNIRVDQLQQDANSWASDLAVGPPINKGPYSCEICSKSFELWASFKKHIKTHLEDKPHRCTKCPATFNVPANLILHGATHNNDALICPECNKTFNRLASLKAHLQLHEHEESLFCTECGDEFNNQSQLDKHMKEHDAEWVKPETKVYKCTHCNRQYAKASILREHTKGHYKMKTSLSVKSHKRALRRGLILHHCETCQKAFQKPSQLLRHKRIHTGEKPFKCEVCSRAFNQKGSMHIHMLKHTGFRPYQCEFCSARFSQKGNLRAHVVRLHTVPNSEESSYKCQLCTCVFRKISGLNAHMNRMHRMAAESVIYIDKNNDGRVSVSLREEFTGMLKDCHTAKDSSDKENDDGQNNGNSNQTVAKVSGNKESGPISHQTYTFGPVINGISKSVTIRSRTCGPSQKWHVCSYCTKEFKKPSDLVRHIRIHTHEKPYKCKYCYRSFAVRSTLTTHVRTHTGDKNYVCYMCSKSFSTSSSLKVHSKTHFREKRYACKVCGEAFTTVGERAAHMVDHKVEVDENFQSEVTLQVEVEEVNTLKSSAIVLEEPYMMTDSGLVQVVQVNPRQVTVDDSVARPHKCSVCSAAFRKSSHLKTHSRIHSGEKPYECPICHKSYVSCTILKGHLRTHLGVKNHKCDDCGKLFSTRSTLRRHMDTHGIGKPFICPYCNKSYKSKSTCKSHIKTHTTVLQLMSQKSQELDQDVEEEQPTEVEMQMEIEVEQEKEQDQVTEEALGQEVIDSSQFICYDEMGKEIGITEVTQTLHADSTGAIMISSLGGAPETLSQESIREIEETLNQQLFGSLSTDKEQTVNPNALFDQTFDHCVFSAITLPGSDQLNLEQVLPTTTNLGSILPEKELEQHGLEQEMPLEKDDDMSKEDDNTGEEILVVQTDLISLASEKPDEFITDCKIADEPFICAVCDKTFTTLAQLKHHDRNHGREKEHNCQICGAAFTAAASLQRHMSVHFEKRTENQLRRHSNEHQQQQTRRRVKRRRGEARQLTEEETNQLVGQLPQNGATVSEKVLIASVAERDKISELRDPTDKFVSEPARPNRCKFCPKSFRKPSDLTRHLRTHTGEKPFQCRCCLKSFTVKSTLDSHMKTHVNIKQFTCHVCGYQFATKGSLKVHMRLHTGSRPFRCPICDQRFRTSGHRKAHLMSHVGEAGIKQISDPDVLQQQDQDESQRGMMAIICEAAEEVEVGLDEGEDANDHQSSLLEMFSPDTLEPKLDATATAGTKDSKAVHCTVCGKDFVKNSCLIRHMRIHTGERPFKCEVCGKMFNQKNAMLIHKQRHSGQKPWTCPECNISFTQKGNLKTHMRRSHQFSPHVKALAPNMLTKPKITSFSIELASSEKVLEYENVIGEFFSPVESAGVTVTV